ncbi:MAG: PQQ-binding-like beta-propeller repeat protein [Planctomycetota bacterium]
MPRRFLFLILLAGFFFEGPEAFSQSLQTGDSPIWGGTPSRNMVSPLTGADWDFNLTEGKNVVWTSPLGSQTYGGPTVIKGKILVGTNNGGNYVKKHEGDRGVVLCFNEADGKFLWQLTRPKIEDSSNLDFPEVGISSIAAAEGDRAWLVTNRCELVCVDLEGFLDKENDGPVTDEPDRDDQDADIVWNLDMLKELGVQPHFLATSSPLIYGDLLLLCTSQGITSGEEGHSDPEAPSFIAVNKTTGKVAWKSNLPGKGILDGQWSSPALGVVNGVAQAIFPASDGWVYSLKAETGELLWKCDLNPKETVWEEGGTGNRNAIVATPVFHENSVIIGVGQNPDHGDGQGHLWRIDATKTGDVSAETGEIGSAGTPNPNSGVLWHYGGEDKDGSVTGEAGESIFFRTISTVAIGDGLVFAADHRGTMHCIDLATGKRQWIHDMMCMIWGSPLLVDGHVLIGTEDGKLLLFKASRTESKPVREYDVKDYAAVYATPVIANDHLILVDRTNLTKVKLKLEAK